MKLTRRIATTIGIALWMCACTSNPVPEGYSGPLAYIKDSVTWGENIGDIFYLSKVDGKPIKNTLDHSTTTGSNGLLYSIAVGRNVPARPTTFVIVGHRRYPRPIDELLHGTYDISGETVFTPVPDRNYDVVGELGDAHSAVWIEESLTHKLVGQKIETKGSTR